jgi:hypothetical protein
LLSILSTVICKDKYSFLKEFENIHKNRKAIILGNGPSVKIEDLEKLALSGFIIFAANRIHLVYPKTSFRPNYVVSSDDQVISEFGSEIKNSNQNVFFSQTNTLFKDKHILLHFRRPFKFYPNPYKGLSSGGGSLFIAIQLAYFMGIRKMYLYGVDHHFKFTYDKTGMTSGEGNHFIPNYRSNKKWIPPRTKLIESSFAICDEYLRREGGFLINSTKGGKLNNLERKGLNEIL